MIESKTKDRYVEIYEHEKERNGGLEAKTKFGSFMKKIGVGHRAGTIQSKLDAAKAKSSGEQYRAKLALDENRITRAEYDQRCGMAKKNIAMLEYKYGYLSEEEFEQRMTQIKNEHKHFYDPCVVRR